MIAKFNPTGTHIHKGFLKVRIDLYPDVTDKTYPIHHIQVPVIPEEGYQGEMDEMGSPVDIDAYNAWKDGLPKVWQLNPALCHFIRIKEASTKASLTDYLEQIFNPTLIKTLDDSLILPNSSHLISHLMRNKSALTTEKIITRDIEDLVASVNSRFASLVLEKASGDRGLPITPQTIVIGAAATDRTAGANIYINTYITEDNPANASGSIDTVEIWMLSAATVSMDVGTIEEVDTNKFTSRDYEDVGDVAAGSIQTFPGLTINVETGDYIGGFSNSGFIEKSGSSGDGYWLISGDQFPCTDVTFDYFTPRAISLHGTGTEAAPAAEGGAQTIMTGAGIRVSGGGGAQNARIGFPAE